MKLKQTVWILNGKLKLRIILALNKPKTATNLSKELKTHRSTISEVLIQMKNKGILVCINSKQPYNRYYQLTKTGKAVLKEVNKFI